jgi:hypothetical protein
MAVNTQVAQGRDTRCHEGKHAPSCGLRQKSSVPIGGTPSSILLIECCSLPLYIDVINISRVLINATFDKFSMCVSCSTSERCRLTSRLREPDLYRVIKVPNWMQNTFANTCIFLWVVFSTSASATQVSYWLPSGPYANNIRGSALAVAGHRTTHSLGSEREIDLPRDTCKGINAINSKLALDSNSHKL